MKEIERIAHVVEVVKAYCNDDLFNKAVDIPKMLGWKLCVTGSIPRIFTTVGWALVDFRINDKYGVGKYVNALKAASLPESKMDVNTYMQVAAHLTEDSWLQTENFAQAVAESDKYIVLPDNHCLNSLALKPLKPFLDDVVSYKQVRDVQMVFKLRYGMEYVHIAPMTQVKDGAFVVKAYNSDMKDCGGLFF